MSIEELSENYMEMFIKYGKFEYFIYAHQLNNLANDVYMSDDLDVENDLTI